MSYIDHNSQFTRFPDRLPRIRHLLRGQLIDDRDRMCDIVIRDVSENGLSATARDAFLLAKGIQVSIVLPGDTVVWAQISWVAETRFGVELETPLDLEQLLAVIRCRTAAPRPKHAWEVHSRHRVHTNRPQYSRFRAI